MLDLGFCITVNDKIKRDVLRFRPPPSYFILALCTMASMLILISQNFNIAASNETDPNMG